MQIGVCVMVHGDDKGLVLPPRVAPVQAVVIWILASSDAEETVKAVHDAAYDVEKTLKTLRVAVKVDDRDNYLPGWKYAHWEQKVWAACVSPASCSGHALYL